MISTAELSGMQAQVAAAHESLRGVFPQIPRSYERYLAYLQNVQQ